jgi:hypothetical protein
VAVCVSVPVIVLAADGSNHGGGSTVSAAAAGFAPVGSTPSHVGSVAQADALGNTVIGGSDRTQLAFRFRATWTGTVVAVRVYVIKNVNGRSGYSEGDGGTMRIALQGDGAGHLPNGRNVASARFRPLQSGFWPLVRFDKPADVVKGRLYHVVFTNVGSDPSSNYASINALYSASRLGSAPTVPDGLAVYESDGGGSGGSHWFPRRSRPNEYYLPIMDVVGGRGGQHDGLGYMEVWDPKPIGGDAGVRQLIRTGSKTTTIQGVWLRVQRDGGSGAPLILSIEKSGGGTLASGSVAAAKVHANDAGWVYTRFDKPAKVAPDSDITLTASASSSSAYEAFPLRKGTEFGFSRSLQYSRGYAQFNDGDGWVGWDQWGGHDRRTSDLQFALDVTR